MRSGHFVSHVKGQIFFSKDENYDYFSYTFSIEKFLTSLYTLCWIMQFVIYKEIRERFDNHLWLDVVSKCDLLQESSVVFITEDGETNHLELAKYLKIGPKGAIHVSVKSEEGLNEVSQFSSNRHLIFIHSTAYTIFRSTDR